MIGIFLILASTYILVYSPYFLLSPSKVLIEAEDDGIDVSIAYRAIEDLYGKNIFSLDEEAIIESIKASQKIFLRFESIDSTRIISKYSLRDIP